MQGRKYSTPVAIDRRKYSLVGQDQTSSLFSNDDEEDFTEQQLHLQQNETTKPRLNKLQLLKGKLTPNLFVNFIKTFSYYIVFMMFGFSLSVIGPTLPSIAQNVSIREDKLGLIFTCKGLGGIIGSIFAGGGYDWLASKSNFYAHMLLAFGVFIMSLGYALIPLIKHYMVLLMVYTVFGAGVGLVNMGCNVLCVWTWREAVTPFILGLSCIAGFGSFLGPIFVTSGVEFKWLYWITSAMVAGSGLLMIFIQAMMRGKLPQDVKIEQAASVGRKNSVHINRRLSGTREKADIRSTLRALTEKTRSTRIALLVGFALFGCVGLESSYTGLIFTYMENKKLLSSPQQGALMMSTFYACMTGSRFIVAFLSAVVRPAVILIINEILVYTSICIYLFLPKTPAMIWAGVCLMSIGISTQFPSAFSFPQTSMKDVQLSATMTSMMMILASAGEMVVPLLVTLLFQRLGPDALFWVLLVTATIPAVSYAILFIWTYFMTRSTRQIEVDKEVVATQTVLVREETTSHETELAASSPTGATTPIEEETTTTKVAHRRFST
jgi:MFS family permease